MTCVLDASAVLAFLQRETGADVVEQHLVEGASCGAANWAEVAQKVRAQGRSWEMARAFLSTYGLRVEAVTQDDAEWAARRWRAREGLSLADRLCLALRERLDVPALTADEAWGSSAHVVQIR